jgi:hypothetical protein
MMPLFEYIILDEKTTAIRSLLYLYFPYFIIIITIRSTLMIMVKFIVI